MFLMSSQVLFMPLLALLRQLKYEGLDVKSIQKKLKMPAFAAQVSREDITDALSRIDKPLEEIIVFIIEHQKEVRDI